MATSTTLGLRKPDGADLVNVAQDVAANMELIDKWARGEIGSAELTVPSATLVNSPTALADVVGLSVGPLALKASRRYKVSFYAMVSSTAADRIEVSIVKDNPAAGTIVTDAISYLLVANEPASLGELARFTQAADASVTFKVQARRRAGTGACIISGNVAFPATLLIEDMGEV